MCQCRTFFSPPGSWNDGWQIMFIFWGHYFCLCTKSILWAFVNLYTRSPVKSYWQNIPTHCAPSHYDTIKGLRTRVRLFLADPEWKGWRPLQLLKNDTDRCIYFCKLRLRLSSVGCEPLSIFTFKARDCLTESEAFSLTSCSTADGTMPQWCA